MVICHSGEVELHPLDFKLTTITLQDDPDSNLRHSIRLRPTFISTPPLSIHLLPIGLDTWLCNGRGDSPSYELHASATANAGSFTAPSYLSMLDLYWLSPCRTVTTIRTGVLCFVPAEGAKAPSKYGFLVVLSVQLPQVPPPGPAGLLRDQWPAENQTWKPCGGTKELLSSTSFHTAHWMPISARGWKF